MRFTIQHPTDTYLQAILGFDMSLVGYFIEIRRARKLVDSYDGLQGTGETSISGVFDLLVKHGFITEDAIAEAMQLLPHMDACDLPDGGTRRAATVIENLRQSAAGG